MTTNTISQRSPIRAILIAIALLFTSIFAANPASASTLIPLVDMGGPGGGGSAQTVDAPVVTSEIGVREF